MSKLEVLDLGFSGLKLVRRTQIDDSRGSFARLFSRSELLHAGWRGPICQINHSRTLGAGTVRGLHFQYPPCDEMKLVSCLQGEVWDVAVDVRKGSPTYLKWRAEILSAENRNALLIPAGFAHGFQALSSGVELLYCHSADYSPKFEGALNPRDPLLDIRWPLQISNISEKDAAHPFVAEAFRGIE